MDQQRDILRSAMRETSTSQSSLARMSGIRQPSISQFLAGTIEMSDAQLDRLLACMGFQLQVTRRATRPQLTRAERRSWLLHRRIATLLSADTLCAWTPQLERNIARLRDSVTGQPHLRNLDRWQQLIQQEDLSSLARALTGLDREAIEMREVAPFLGILPHDERLAALNDRVAS